MALPTVNVIEKCFTSSSFLRSPFSCALSYIDRNTAPVIIDPLVHIILIQKTHPLSE